MATKVSLDKVEANQPRVVIPDDARTVAYLHGVGQDLWAVTTGTHGTAVISVEDLFFAKVEALSNASAGDLAAATLEDENDSESLAEAAQAEVARRGLESGIENIERLLKEVFGGEAYVVPTIQEDPETGEQDLAIEAHYGFSLGDEEKLQEVLGFHDTFLRRYVREIEPSVRGQIALLWTPLDHAH